MTDTPVSTPASIRDRFLELANKMTSENPDQNKETIKLTILALGEVAVDINRAATALERIATSADSLDRQRL